MSECLHELADTDMSVVASGKFCAKCRRWGSVSVALQHGLIDPLPTPALEALRELLAVKELRDKHYSLWKGWSDEAAAIDYNRRVLIAWDRARAVLKGGVMKLTPWFPPEVKPVHVGPYESIFGGWYRYWDGTRWHFGGDTPAKAVKNVSASPAPAAWRGLARKP